MGSLPDDLCGSTEDKMGTGWVTASSKDIVRVAYANSVYSTAEIAKQSDSSTDMVHHVNSPTPCLEK